MKEIGHLNIEGAKAHPEAYFSSPFDLVEEVLLTRGEKLATLDRWRTHVLRELEASRVGFLTDGPRESDADLLEAIDQARRQLAMPLHA
jgi:hypothetical protein